MRWLVGLSWLGACAPVSVVPGTADGEGGQRVVVDCDGDRLGPAGEALLAPLATSEGVSDLETAEARLEEVATLFEACADRRGLFATAYRPITRASVAAIDAGRFDDPAWAEALVVDFAGRYLDGLGAELRVGSAPWAWDRYYRLADDAGVSDQRLVVTGMLAHLVLDLPNTLAVIGSHEGHEGDFFAWGDLLVDVTPDLVDDLAHHHGVDVSDLLEGFFWGRGLDAWLGEGTSTALSFQTLRRKAWNNGQWLQRPGLGWAAESEIWVSFWFLDGVLATLDATGVLK